MRMYGFYHDIIMEKLEANLNVISIECTHKIVNFTIKKESEFIVSLTSNDGIIIKYNTKRLVITKAICKKPKNDEVVLDLYRICVTLSGGWD